ncbi:MAG: type I secretion system permease/ATPase [Alphaproteobacteria bacterium]|nr:type I secretion system permease/ATPase [Alphaproteobacteria bacterium]
MALDEDSKDREAQKKPPAAAPPADQAAKPKGAGKVATGIKPADKAAEPSTSAEPETAKSAVEGPPGRSEGAPKTVPGKVRRGGSAATGVKLGAAQGAAEEPSSAGAAKPSEPAAAAGADEQAQPQRRWSVSRAALKADVDDPLLGCLALMTKLHERTQSAEALVSGLPLEDGRLSPELFLRAAERAGLTGNIVKRPLSGIPDFALPVVLLLREGSACVLARRPDADSYEILTPESGGAQSLSAEALGEAYSGYAIFVRPEYVDDDRLGGGALSPPKRSWFWGTVFQFWPTYSQVIIASLLINSFALVLPLFIMNVYDRVVPNNAIETLWVLAIGAGTAIFFDFFMRMLRGYFVDSAGKRADTLLSAQIFERVQDIQMSSRPGSAGAFANILRDFETVREFLTSATVTAFADIPFIALFILVIYLIAGPVAFIPAVAVPIALIVGIILQAPLKSAISKTQVEAAQKHGILVETIGGLETIKSLNAQGRLQSKWEQFVAKTAASSLQVRVLALGIITVSMFLTQISTIGVIVYGVYLIQDGVLTTGALIAAVILNGRALGPLSQVANLLARMNQSMSALGALNNIMSLPVERPAGKRFLQRPTFRGAINFREVSFTYPGADLAALDKVSFSINAGERVAFIGRVGSGKSTVAKLILGLYAPDEGAVLVDRTDLRQVDPIDLRRNMGAILQDSFLFHGTVRDNIALGAPNADDEAILEAAVTAGVHEFVRRHPHGYDLMVGERGEGLSGGQRQAVALARALVRKPPILVLDEPTSGIDVGTEKAFISRLAPTLRGRTLVLVTHRASLLPLVERIIILDQGRVVADGPRAEVLEALNSGKIKVDQA